MEIEEVEEEMKINREGGTDSYDQVPDNVSVLDYSW